MNENPFEVGNESRSVRLHKQKRNYKVILLVTASIGVLLILVLGVIVSIRGVYKGEEIILTDGPHDDCPRIFCQEEDLGYIITSYYAGYEFESGLYTIEMTFDQQSKDNKYILGVQLNSTSIFYPFKDGRSVAFNAFGTMPSDDVFKIYNVPFIDMSYLEVLVKEEGKAEIKLVPQDGYITIDEDGPISEGYYPVGRSIEPGTYQLNDTSYPEPPAYTIFGPGGEIEIPDDQAEFVLEEDQTLVIESTRAEITKVK